jgi:hypothetical protein
VRVTLALALVAAAASTARADRKHVAEADPAPDDDQVIVVNTAQKIGDIGQIDRIHRVLDQRGMLFRMSTALESTLEGRNAVISDTDVIRDAYADNDYKTALKIIDADEQRILDNAVGDLAPAMSELAAWRGMIAAVLDQEDEALRQFRAAYRFNPAWSIDKKLASHRVRSLVIRAKREPEDKGTLRVDADPDDATMIIDASERRPATDHVKLPVGLHLVQISAPGRGSYAEVVDIEADKAYPLPITLDPETKLDRAAKLVDESAAAPAGKARLRRARGLSRLTGVKRILFIEGGGEHHINVRLYDLTVKKVSRSLEFDGGDSSATIASEIKSALDPDNLLDVNTIVVHDTTREESHWYNHWYVWAAAAAVVGGSYLGYEYATREPTALRGF